MREKKKNPGLLAGPFPGGATPRHSEGGAVLAVTALQKVKVPLGEQVWPFLVTGGPSSLEEAPGSEPGEMALSPGSPAPFPGIGT